MTNEQFDKINNKLWGIEIALWIILAALGYIAASV